MWISKTATDQNGAKKQMSGFLANFIPPGSVLGNSRSPSYEKRRRSDNAPEFQCKENALVNASNIGNALMIINSYRTLAIMWAITGLFPLFQCLMSSLRNVSGLEMTNNLQAINLIVTDTTKESCEFLIGSTTSWVAALVAQNYGDLDSPSLLALQISPPRCGLDAPTTVLPILCDPLEGFYNESGRVRQTCDTYELTNEHENPDDLASFLGIRVGSITAYTKTAYSNFTDSDTNSSFLTTYSVETSFDQSFSIQITYVFKIR